MSAGGYVMQLGSVPYTEAWALQRSLAGAVSQGAIPDTIVLLEHPPVVTLGRRTDQETELHIPAGADVELVETDRGGKSTFHGPGQLVVYPLLDLPRLGLGVRGLVVAIERAISDTVAEWGIAAAGRRDAPGVYVDGRKLASIGLRIRRGHSYHGLALNVAMDLEPFRRINPCGYAGLEMTQLTELGGPSDLRAVAAALAPRLLAGVGLDPQSATSTRWQDVRSR